MRMKNSFAINMCMATDEKCYLCDKRGQFAVSNCVSSSYGNLCLFIKCISIIMHFRYRCLCRSLAVLLILASGIARGLSFESLPEVLNTACRQINLHDHGLLRSTHG